MGKLESWRALVREAIGRERPVFFAHVPAIVAGIIREKGGRPAGESVLTPDEAR